MRVTGFSKYIVNTDLPKRLLFPYMKGLVFPFEAKEVEDVDFDGRKLLEFPNGEIFSRFYFVVEND